MALYTVIIGPMMYAQHAGASSLTAATSNSYVAIWLNSQLTHQVDLFKTI